MTQGERIMGVEVEVRELKKAFEEQKVITAKEFEVVKNEFSDVNKKLDDLLTLRNKGAGVFWLISSLVGAGIIGAVVQFMTYLRAH